MEFFGTPTRVLAAQSNQLLGPQTAELLRTAARPSGKFLETLGPSAEIARAPFIAGRRADAELATKRTDIGARQDGEGDEIEKVLVGRGFPGHAPSTAQNSSLPSTAAGHLHPRHRFWNRALARFSASLQSALTPGSKNGPEKNALLYPRKIIFGTCSSINV
jgi:hypothetical protein